MAEGNLLTGILGFSAIFGLVWLITPTVSDEANRKAGHCQDQAVAMDLGVVQDDTGRYHYSHNKLVQLRYYRFMASCLPDDYPTKKQMIDNVQRVRNELGFD